MHCIARVDGAARGKKAMSSTCEFHTVGELVGGTNDEVSYSVTRILVDVVVNNMNWSRTLGGTTKLLRERGKLEPRWRGVLIQCLG